MKNKILFTAIVVVFLTSGFHSHRETVKLEVFQTQFGYIRQGDSMTDVMAVLGNPHDVSNYKRRENWQYDFAEKGKIFVYFVEGAVSKVHLEELEAMQ